MLRIPVTGKNVVNLTNSQAIQSRGLDGVQHGGGGRQNGVVVAAGGALEGGCALKGTGDDAANGVLAVPFVCEHITGDLADMVQLGDGDFILVWDKKAERLPADSVQAREYLEANNIAYLEKTGNTTDEVISAASSLVGRVDAVFTPTDNVVMGAEAAVAEILNEAGIPHYTGADSFVAAGAFTTCGVNYTELGAYTADMAVEILQTGKVPGYHVMDGGIIAVNTETASRLNLDYSVFSTMANTVKEMTTEE